MAGDSANSSRGGDVGKVDADDEAMAKSPADTTTDGCVCGLGVETEEKVETVLDHDKLTSRLQTLLDSRRTMQIVLNYKFLLFDWSATYPVQRLGHQGEWNEMDLDWEPRKDISKTSSH